MVVETEPEVMFANQILMLISAPLLQDAKDKLHNRFEAVAPLSVQEELEALIDAFGRLDNPIEFELKIEFATLDTLQRILAAETRPLIIHFIGHGMRSDNGIALVLENDVGKARPLYVRELGILLEPFSSPPCQLALLNACHSQGMADALLEAGVRHIVAINADDSILDTAARCFARYFYPALLANRKVHEAFRQARNAVLLDDGLAGILDPQTHQPVNWREALKFHLLPEDSPEHNRPLDYEWVAGKTAAPRWERTNLDRASKGKDYFVGRRVDLYHVQSHLSGELRCVAIHGMGGMGKTVLAEEVGRWQHERKRWRDGVWHIRLRNALTASQARERIATDLGLSAVAAQSDTTMAAALAEWRVLLILDDLDALLESDWEGTIKLLNSLLGCQWLRLLVTSRHNLPGQILYQPHILKRMDRADAQRAYQKYNPSLKLWEVNQKDWNALMDFLDGYPFPIRLAARYMEQMGHLSLRPLLQQLGVDPLKPLHYLGETEDREKSLAATLKVSYDALPPGARDVFPLLGLFPAGLTEDAARSIIGETSVGSLEILLQFSMTEVHEAFDFPRRFVLPEPARQYAKHHQLSGTMDRYAPAALDFFLNFMGHANNLFTAEQYEQYRQLLVQEEPNFDDFLKWGYDYEQRSDGVSRSARATALLAPYWRLLAPWKFSLARETLNSAIQAARRSGDQLAEAQIKKALGELLQSREEWSEALANYAESVNLYTALKDSLNAAHIQKAIANIQLVLAQASYKKALTFYKAAEREQEAVDMENMINRITEIDRWIEGSLTIRVFGNRFEVSFLASDDVNPIDINYCQTKEELVSLLSRLRIHEKLIESALKDLEVKRQTFIPIELCVNKRTVLSYVT